MYDRCVDLGVSTRVIYKEKVSSYIGKSDRVDDGYRANSHSDSSVDKPGNDE